MKANPVLPAEDPLYPSSDGLPLAENDWQLTAILDAVGMLKLHYRDQSDVYVSGDLLIYYEEGNPAKCVAPDVFVVFGAPKHNRMVYKLWEEPKAPDFVLEVASENTWRKDLGEKRALYAELGVRECWLFDPRDEYFDPPLQGLVLRGGAYRALPTLLDSGARTIPSEVLGLDVSVANSVLRFRDPATGEYLRNLAEEKAARRAAEARVAELEARLREP